MLISEALETVGTFSQELRDTKIKLNTVSWYPYDSLSNVPLMKRAVSGNDIDVRSVLDVGPADGDIAFLFARAGCSVSAIELESTNFNSGNALLTLNAALGNRVGVRFCDVDFGFSLAHDYDLCVATGIAYHLRNPMLFYITLAQHCRYLITNTRVIDEVDSGMAIGNQPLAYILECRECNDDPTNWWLFTPAAYLRVLTRCGWHVKNHFSVGASVGNAREADKRMWAFCERVPNYADLRKHHDF